ncbi:MAG: dihydrolipoamide acetyltransferase family protein [Thermodesulfobacteriota bacterium]|nr:dihydrolipoamide acetyltransferase family protein [Thermodesulfobacteriota bacterium]
MAINITMPKWGLTMKEGKISKWFKQEGDSVEKGEDLFEVETEKITNKVESTASGVLFQIVVTAGQTVPVATIVAIIAESGEQPERVEGIQAGEVVEGKAASPGDAGKDVPEKNEEKKLVRSSPAARRLAKEQGIDIAQVPGTGPEGRITMDDVTRYKDEKPLAPRITPLAAEMAKQADLDVSSISGTGEGGKITKEDVNRELETGTSGAESEPGQSIPFTGMRKSIADNMHASLQNAAQLTTFTEVDVTGMVDLRDLLLEKYKNDETVKISYNDIIIMATARTLKQFPLMNSALLGEEILLHDRVNIGMAVALPEGLIVPKIRDADKKSLLEIAHESREIAKKSREGTLSVEEVTDGTFTISNVSMLDMDGFTPILNPPETGILGVGRVKEKPAVHKGEITIRSMMTLSLTFDHRVIDGAPAMQFLRALAKYLEHPVLMMV